MKKTLLILAGIVFLLIVVGTGVFLFKKSQKKPVVYQTEQPFRADIVKKAVATGAVVPRQEVAIKPLVSGIIDELYVEAGEQVRKGELVAKVRVIPDMANLNDADTRVNKAEIALADAQREYERQKRLVEDGTVSRAEFQRAEVAYHQAREDLGAARSNLDIVRRGSSTRLGATTNTLVPATMTGMVLEVPLEVGNSVIEANNFNDGTTIATIADMGDMIFEGRVDESEVGKIRTGMALVLTIGALEGQTFDATLEHIAPKGVEEEGAIQFEIRAAVKPRQDVLIRANYSANADIVLDRRQGVLAIHESLLQFEGEKPFVEVEVAPQQFERRDVQVGLSDGLQIEVVSGLAESDKVKNPNPDAAPAGPPRQAAAGAARQTARRG